MTLLTVKIIVEATQTIRQPVAFKQMGAHVVRTVIANSETYVLLRDIVFLLIKFCAPTLTVQMVVTTKLLPAKKVIQITPAHQIVIAVLEGSAKMGCAKTAEYFLRIRPVQVANSLMLGHTP